MNELYSLTSAELPIDAAVKHYIDQMHGEAVSFTLPTVTPCRQPLTGPTFARALTSTSLRPGRRGHVPTLPREPYLHLPRAEAPAI